MSKNEKTELFCGFAIIHFAKSGKLIYGERFLFCFETQELLHIHGNCCLEHKT